MQQGDTSQYPAQADPKGGIQPSQLDRRVILVNRYKWIKMMLRNFGEKKKRMIYFGEKKKNDLIEDKTKSS